MAKAATLVFFALDAIGETGVEPVRLEYRAPNACPSEQQVIADILGRTNRARAARPDEAARSFRLTVGSEPNGASGQIEIVAQDGARTVRKVRGNDCGEVVSALTLIARIAIDPEQALGGDTPPAPVKPLRAESRPEARSENAGRDRRGTPTNGSVSPRFRLGIGAQALATTLVSPNLAPGAGIVADLTGAPPSWLSFRAGIRTAFAAETATAAGTARFTLIAVHLGTCAPRVEWSEDFGFCPIALIESGALSARGSETLRARNETRPWLAVGAGIRMEWRIASRIFVDAEAEASAPLIRDRFVFDSPPTDVHETPALGAVAALGLGYRLP